MIKIQADTWRCWQAWCWTLPLHAACSVAPAFFRILSLTEGCPGLLCNLVRDWRTAESECSVLLDAASISATSAHAPMDWEESSVASNRVSSWRQANEHKLHGAWTLLSHVIQNCGVYLADLLLMFSPSEAFPATTVCLWCPGQVMAKDCMSSWDTIRGVGLRIEYHWDIPDHTRTRRHGFWTWNVSPLPWARTSTYPSSKGARWAHDLHASAASWSPAHRNAPAFWQSASIAVPWI